MLIYSNSFHIMKMLFVLCLFEENGAAKKKDESRHCARQCPGGSGLLFHRLLVAHKEMASTVCKQSWHVSAFIVSVVILLHGQHAIRHLHKVKVV